MATLDFPTTDGVNNQRREWLYRQITKYRPDLADSPDLIYGDLELIYLRFLNDGTIPDAIEGVGPTGAPGIQGPQGIQGIPGEKGEKGDKGDKGDTGVTGSTGLTGAQGIQGIKGDKGDKGDTGIEGPQGTAGATGATGAQGIKGDKGDQGIQGIQGIKGDTGLKGADGTSVTIKGRVPTSADLPATGNTNGDGWVTDNDRHLWVWTNTSFTDVGLVAGPKGDQGIQGIQGIQGTQGIKGDKGDQGTSGIDGDTGPTGPQGQQGPQGIQGIQGVKGDNGTDGVSPTLAMTPIAAGTHLDTLLTAGNYQQGQNTQATLALGYPLDGYACRVKVDQGVANSNSFIYQEAEIYASAGATHYGKKFRRQKYVGNAFMPWELDLRAKDVATTTANGSMSSADKVILNSLNASVSAAGDIVRTNYVTNTISTVGYQVSPGTGGAGALSFQNVLANGKLGFIRYTQNTPGTSASGIATSSSTTPKAVAIGDVVVASGWIRTNKTGNTSLLVQARYRVGAAATPQPAITQTFLNVPANTWIKFNVEVDPALYVADNVYVSVLFSQTNGATYPAAGNYVDLSAFVVEDGAYAGPYFDGSTPPTGIDGEMYSVGWAGAANGSSSHLYAKANTVKRDTNGNFYSTPPVANEAVANKRYVDRGDVAVRLDKRDKPVIGFHRSGATYTGPTQFVESYEMEAIAQAKSDTISYYHPVNENTAYDYAVEVAPELESNPERKLMWALQIDYLNQAFNDEFDAQGQVYHELVATFEAIIAGGNMERVYLAPMHECNGPGSAIYSWQMNDSGLYGYGTRPNTPAKYIAAYKRIVNLARAMGVKAKFIQWFLINNSKSSDPAVVEEAIEDGYVGDDYVDIIGVSYYNRYEKDGSSGSTWTNPGQDIRRFCYRIGQYSRNPIWSCETGCYDSDPTDIRLNKGQWYADVINMVASNEIPNWHGVILFLQTPGATGVPVDDHDYYPENNEQFRMIGRAMNNARKGVNPIARSRHSKNLLHPTVSVPSSTAGWTSTNGGSMSIVTETPRWMDKGSTALRMSKASSATPVNEDYAFYRTTDLLNDWEPNQPYTLSFTARASSEKFKLSAGVQQMSGSTPLFVGEDGIQLQTQWAEYTVTFGNKTVDNAGWRIPCFRIGANGTTGWAEVTDIKLEKGTYATPNTDKTLTPRVRVMDAVTQNWSCEYGDIYTLTLTSNRTLAVPTGTPYDGQEISIRVKQDATGTRTLTQSSNFRTSSVSGTLQTAPNTTNLLTYHYDASAGKWGLIRNISWGA